MRKRLSRRASRRRFRRGLKVRRRNLRARAGRGGYRM